MTKPPNQPRLARNPIVILHEEGGQFVVQSWFPPRGIWQRLGEPASFAVFEEALNLSNRWSASIGGHLAYDIRSILAAQSPTPDRSA